MNQTTPSPKAYCCGDVMQLQARPPAAADGTNMQNLPVGTMGLGNETGRTDLPASQEYGLVYTDFLYFTKTLLRCSPVFRVDLHPVFLLEAASIGCASSGPGM